MIIHIQIKELIRQHVFALCITLLYFFTSTTTALQVVTDTRTFINNTNKDVKIYAKTWGTAPIGGIQNAIEYKNQDIIRPGKQLSITYDNPCTRFSEITFLYPNNPFYIPQRRYAIHGINDFSIYTLEQNGEVKMSNAPNTKIINPDKESCVP